MSCIFFDVMQLRSFYYCELEEVIDSVHGQLRERYKEVKLVRGPKVSYLGMTLDFSEPGKAK